MICSNLIHIQTLFDKFHLRTKFRPDGLSLSIIMAKVHVFIVSKLMTSSDFLYSRELSKTKNEFKKIWGGLWKVVHGRVQGVVHGLGVSVFNSPDFQFTCIDFDTLAFFM